MQKKRHIAAVMELSSPYKRHYGIFSGIQKYAESHADWSFELSNYPQYLMANGVKFDGIIGRISKDCALAARDAAIPVVNVHLDSPSYSKMHGVYNDYHAAGRMAAEHLIARGLRRLAHFGHQARASTLHYKGMLAVATEHGYPCDRYVVNPLFEKTLKHWSRFVEYVEKAQSNWKAPLGIGFVSDDLCRAVTSTCITMNWIIPEQLAMVGSSNDEIICTSIDPTLSSIDMGHPQCGFEAAKLLDSLIQGDVVPIEPRSTPVKALMVRRSSDVFAVSDPKVEQALRHMANHSGDRISVPLIAEVVGLGRKTLEQRFKRNLGRTINDELIRLRVETLKRLLVEDDQSIIKLSTIAGFGTTGNMHEMFKRRTGMTPAEYRKKHGPRPKRYEIRP